MRRSIQPHFHGHAHHLLLLLMSAKDLVKCIETLIMNGRRSERRGSERRKEEEIAPIRTNAHASDAAPEPLDVFILKIEVCLGWHHAAREEEEEEEERRWRRRWWWW